jgi:hypothetical protein
MTITQIPRKDYPGFSFVRPLSSRQQETTPACRNGLRRAGTAFGRGGMRRRLTGMSPRRGVRQGPRTLPVGLHVCVIVS